MIIKEIQLTQEEMNELEKVYYDYEVLKDNVAFMIELHASDANFLDSETYAKLAEKQRKAYEVYINTKNEYTIKYIPQEILDANKYIWQADFVNHKLVIME